MSPAPLVELSDSIRTAPSFDDAARALLAFMVAPAMNAIKRRNGMEPA